MTDFTHKMSGGVVVGGICSATRVEYFYGTRFAVGSFVYNCRRARIQGKLEKLVVKKIKILFNPPGVLYTDSLNGLWREEELCSFDEALNFALAYQQNRADSALKLIEKC